jgi:hypothetical protein
VKKKRLLMLLVGLAGCVDAGNPDLATEFRETPLRALGGVEIGMSAQRLRSARPDAVTDPGSGMRERIPGYSVAYKFRMTSMDGANEIAPAERLLAVFMTRQVSSYEEAETAWREQIRTLAKAKRKPDLCESVAGGGAQARWFASERMLVIGAFPGNPAYSTVVPRMLLAMGLKDAINEPRGAAPTACPTS